MDSSSNLKRNSDENDSDDVDMNLNLAPCPSSLIKDSSKRNLTARLSLNDNLLNNSLEPLDISPFTSSLKKKSNGSDDLLNKNSLNSHNSNGKLSQSAIRNSFGNYNSNEICILTNSDEHRTDEGKKF